MAPFSPPAGRGIEVLDETTVEPERFQFKAETDSSFQRAAARRRAFGSQRHPGWGWSEVPGRVPRR
jgi:hypothetical protein